MGAGVDIETILDVGNADARAFAVNQSCVKGGPAAEGARSSR
jgi:hypothetical protein